jgi:hypothetical protein
VFDPDGHIDRIFREEIGLEISKPKTKLATETNLCGEFASRNINNGRDVSRVSANICRAVKRNLLDLPELTRHLTERKSQ